MNSIVFFDIDHTIIDGSTGLFVLAQMWREKRISVRDLSKALYFSFLYKMGVFPYERGIRWIYHVCGKITIDELKMITDIAYEKYVLPSYFSEAIDVIESYRDEGYLLCLATASSDYIAHKIKNHVRADFVICNPSTVKDDHLTDELDSPICYGVGKKIMAQQLADETGIDLRNCIFYSDSITDLPLLKAVGKPVIVNPAKKARWYKRLENYDTVYWKINKIPK